MGWGKFVKILRRDFVFFLLDEQNWGYPCPVFPLNLGCAPCGKVEVDRFLLGNS